MYRTKVSSNPDHFLNPLKGLTAFPADSDGPNQRQKSLARLGYHFVGQAFLPVPKAKRLGAPSSIEENNRKLSHRPHNDPAENVRKTRPPSEPGHAPTRRHTSSNIWADTKTAQSWGDLYYSPQSFFSKKCLPENLTQENLSKTCRSGHNL